MRTRKIRLLAGLLAAVLLCGGCGGRPTGIYDVRDFGAVGDGRSLTTKHLQAAIDRCAGEGGGVVLVPKGDYLTGTLNLRSRVEFRFEQGARLVATTDLTQYQKHNDELAGVFYTEDADRVSITGPGVVFGQGMEFMHADSAKVIAGPALDHVRQGAGLRAVADGGVGDGPLHPKERFHQMIVFSNCTNVELRDFTCIDSPYWCFLLVHCDRAEVHNLKIDNNLLIPNSDGLDIISSSNVNVSDCYISCGDDAVVLAGYDWHFGDPGFKRIARPSRNINLSNCILRSRSSAIRIGGWDQNPMSDYNFSNITIFDSNCGIGICIRDYAGVENLNFTNVNIRTRLHTGDWWGHGEPIKITAIRGRESVPGAIRNVRFTNVACDGENSVTVYAAPECTVENIVFSNFDFRMRQSALDAVAGGNFDFRPTVVGEKEFFASDTPVVYLENVRNVRFAGGTIGWEGPIGRSYFTAPVEAAGVHGLTLAEVLAEPSPADPAGRGLVADGCTKVRKDRKGR